MTVFHTMKRINYPAMLALLVMLTGCSLTPVLVMPKPSLPERYPSWAVEAGLQESGPGWRQMFGDPRLQALIELALANNHDLRLAMLNVDAVRAQYQIQRSDRLPALEASVGRVRQRTAGEAGLPGTVQTQSTVNLGMTAFEVDLFGRVRALSEAAFARYLASEYGQRAAHITLVAAVAEAYFAERLAEEQQRLTVQTLEGWQQSLDLTRKLKEGLQGNALDLAQAEGQVAVAQADLALRTRALLQARNRLVQLIGSPLPDTLPHGLSLEQQAVQLRLPAGLPSALLVRRPDIRQAEQALIAANADIGAARAAFFPRVSLTASLGFASSSMGSLFQGDQRVWSFTPQLTQPLFQGGRLRAELRLAEVRKSVAVVEYEKAIQGAFREVADGLAGTATYGRQLAAQQQVVSSAERRSYLSRLRYQAGQDSRLEWLDAQRQLFAAQQALLELRRDEFVNAVALYRALGGGFTPDAQERVS